MPRTDEVPTERGYYWARVKIDKTWAPAYFDPANLYRGAGSAGTYHEENEVYMIAKEGPCDPRAFDLWVGPLVLPTSPEVSDETT